VKLLRENDAVAVVHLAFVSEQPRVAEDAHGRMWQANVAGVARMMEAISEVNRHGGNVRSFIYMSSTSVYGPDGNPLLEEEAPLGAQALVCAVQKAEADGVVRFRAGGMGKCSTYVLRPHLFAGPRGENYLVSAIRGRALGNGKLAQRLKRRQKRISIMLPMGAGHERNLLQCVHIDDVARLVAWLLRKAPAEAGGTLTLNVAGSGQPISMANCAEIGQTRIRRLPTRWLCQKVMAMLWQRGISAVPTEAFPYLTGSCTVSTRRLKALLGGDYAQVIQYSSEAALRDGFKEEPLSRTAQAE